MLHQPQTMIRSNVRVGSKPEKLHASICFPLCPRKQTFRYALGMSVSCQYATLGSARNEGGRLGRRPVRTPVSPRGRNEFGQLPVCDSTNTDLRQLEHSK